MVKGRYTVIRPLGRGGMGIVLVGEDPQLGRRAAIKVLSPLLAERVADSLGSRRLLLVLDNCEHLIEPVARIAEALLHGAPHLVPLPRQAVAVFRDLHELTGRGKLVFRGERHHDRPMSNNTINAGFRAMGFAADDGLNPDALLDVAYRPTTERGITV